MTQTTSKARWTPPAVCIQTTERALQPRADALSERCRLAGLALATDDPAAWQVSMASDRITLSRPDGLEVSVDFTSGKSAYRKKHEAQSTRQPLARAVGITAYQRRYQKTPEVIDATAGLGQDAWLLAAMGCRMTLLERSVILHAMLETALAQATRQVDSMNAANRCSLHLSDAVTWLQHHPDACDVVYLDPMYPRRKGAAKARKGMQLLHELLGPPAANDDLLHAAIASARYRVVVKRPAGADRLDVLRPWPGQVTSVASPNTRFDVYHCR